MTCPTGLVLSDVRIALGGTPLIAVDATVRPGEVLTLMGPSGSGKSTLLAYIGGFLDPVFAASGAVTVDGVELTRSAGGGAPCRHSLPGSAALPASFGAGNVGFAIPPDVARRADRRRLAAAALAEVGLAGFGDRDPATLSGGQKARVALLRVLLSKPRLLLLDEPFSRLDMALRRQTRDLVFERARAAGLPVVLVTHDAADAEAAGGRGRSKSARRPDMAIELPDLPVRPVLPDVGAALDSAGQAVLAAPPGAGKTTLVPLFLLDAAWRGDGRIILVEPRRLAARAAARRMAALLGEPVGQTVGYRMRLDTRVSEATRIEVVTEGVFARMVLDDPELTGVAAVIFDEFHERALDADFGLALALDIRGGLRDDLRILVMSATLDTARVAAILGGAPVVESRGRAFPVEIRYRDRPPRRADRSGHGKRHRSTLIARRKARYSPSSPARPRSVEQPSGCDGRFGPRNDDCAALRQPRRPCAGRGDPTGAATVGARSCWPRPSRRPRSP